MILYIFYFICAALLSMIVPAICMRHNASRNVHVTDRNVFYLNWRETISLPHALAIEEQFKKIIWDRIIQNQHRYKQGVFLNDQQQFSANISELIDISGRRKKFINIWKCRYRHGFIFNSFHIALIFCEFLLLFLVPKREDIVILVIIISMPNNTPRNFFLFCFEELWNK